MGTPQCFAEEKSAFRGGKIVPGGACKENIENTK